MHPGHPLRAGLTLLPYPLLYVSDAEDQTILRSETVPFRPVTRRLRYPRDCLANPNALEPAVLGKSRICFKCHQEGHVSTHAAHHNYNGLSTNTDCKGLYF